MMDKWLKKSTPGDKGLTRPPSSAHVSTHKNEVRSIVHGHFQNRFKVSPYRQVGRPTHYSQKREETLEKVTNVFMEQYTLPPSNQDETGSEFLLRTYISSNPSHGSKSSLRHQRNLIDFKESLQVFSFGTRREKSTHILDESTID